MRLFYIIFNLLLPFIGYSQLKFDELTALSSKVYNQEKVYVEFDKNFYTSGDEIWMKCFVFNGYQLTNLSKRLYIELLDQNKQVRDKKMVALVGGNADVSISLNKDLAENIYYIRAYTNLSANTPLEIKSVFPIKVYRNDSNKQIVKKINSDFEAKVFVEGGKGFIDKKSKYVVRIFNQFDPNFVWEAHVINQNNQKITSVNILDQNIGIFDLVPKKNEVYYINIISNKGKEMKILMNNIYDSGTSLELLSNEKGVKYYIKSNNLNEDLKDYKIVATHNNQIIYSATVNYSTSIINQFLDNDRFSNLNGIITFSLFDKNGIKTNERLYFLRNSLEQLAYKKTIIKNFNRNERQINELIIPEDHNRIYHINIKDSENEYDDNFLSALFYSNDFSSKILYPKNYFNQNYNYDKLDALLITEKWERFFDNSLKKPDDLNFSFSGKLTYNNAPLANVNINLILQSDNKTINVLQKETNSKGEFDLDNLFFNGALNVFYKINSNHSLKIDENKLKLTFVPSYKYLPMQTQLPLVGYYLVENDQVDENRKEIASKIIETQKEKDDYENNVIKLKEVVIKQDLISKAQELNNKLSFGMFRSPTTERIYDFVNDPTKSLGYTDLVSWLTSKVPGLTVKYIDGKTEFYRRGSRIGIYLNEMMMSDNFFVNFNQIAMIKVYTGNSFLGNSIAIYLKSGEVYDESLDDTKQKNVPIIRGYDFAKEYLTLDDYETNYINNSTDTREVLLWKTIYSPNSESNKLNFYSNDLMKNVNLEIISSDLEGNIQYYSE